MTKDGFLETFRSVPNGKYLGYDARTNFLGHAELTPEDWRSLIVDNFQELSRDPHTLGALIRWTEKNLPEADFLPVVRGVKDILENAQSHGQFIPNSYQILANFRQDYQELAKPNPDSLDFKAEDASSAYLELLDAVKEYDQTFQDDITIDTDELLEAHRALPDGEKVSRQLISQFYETNNLSAEEWHGLLIGNFDILKKDPDAYRSLISSAASRLTDEEFKPIHDQLVTWLKEAREGGRQQQTFDYFAGARQLYKYPELLTEIFKYERTFADERDFDRFVDRVTNRYDLLKVSPEVMNVIINEGLAYFNGIESLSIPGFDPDRISSEDFETAYANMGTYLTHFDFSFVRGMEPLDAIDFLIKGHPQEFMQEDAYKTMAENVLFGMAEHHSSFAADHLDMYVDVFGADRAVEIIQDMLVTSGNKMQVLMGLAVEEERYRRTTGERDFSDDKIQEIMVRPEVIAAALTEREVRNAMFNLRDVGETHYSAYRSGLSGDIGVSTDVMQTMLIDSLNFGAMRYTRINGLTDDDIDEKAIEALQRGSLPLAEHYVGEYLMDEDPKRILTNSALRFMKQKSPVLQEILKEGLEALGYDPEMLEEITGKSLTDLPFPLIHQTASDETLSAAMLNDPTAEFQAHVPGFGKPESKSAQEYVITVELNRNRGRVNYKPHLMATANIMDRTLTAVGQTGIKTIAIDAGRGGSDSFLSKGGPLLDGALVVQSSTGTNWNKLSDFGITNTDIIMVYSADNDGDRPDLIDTDRGTASLFNYYSDPNTQWNRQDPTTARHLAVANTIEFGASIYDPKTGMSRIPKYSQTDGQVFLTIPGFASDYDFHSAKNGPYKGKFKTGTSFFSPSGSAYIAEAVARAKTEFPDLEPHQILYAMAQTAEPVAVVQGVTTRDEGVHLFSVASPHGVEYSQRGGFGDFRRERFYDMLEQMQNLHVELAAADPANAEGLSLAIMKEDTINFDFSQDNAELTADGRQKLPLTIDVDKVTTRPVFTMNYDFSEIKEKWGLKENKFGGYNLVDKVSGDRVTDEERYRPIRITAPNGASFDYIVDIWGSKGMATISGIGFMGSETKGQWVIEAKDPEFPIPVLSVDVDLFTTSKNDLITRPEFRKLHTLESIAGQDLSHLSDIWIQDGGAHGEGGWISNAVEEGWQDTLDLSGVSLDPNLMDVLPRSEDLPTGFMGADEIAKMPPDVSRLPPSKPDFSGLGQKP